MLFFCSLSQSPIRNISPPLLLAPPSTGWLAVPASTHTKLINAFSSLSPFLTNGFSFKLLACFFMDFWQTSYFKQWKKLKQQNNNILVREQDIVYLFILYTIVHIKRLTLKWNPLFSLYIYCRALYRSLHRPGSFVYLPARVHPAPPSPNKQVLFSVELPPGKGIECTKPPPPCRMRFSCLSRSQWNILLYIK